MHAYVESRCANNAFEGCTRHLYVLRMHLYVSVHMHSVGSTGGEMYPRRGLVGWQMLLLSGVSGTQGIGYRHAWWICDVSHFSTGLTYLDRCIFRHGTEYEVLLRTISMLYQMKRVGRLVRTRSWSLQMWLALVLRSKSIYADSQLTGWSSVRSIHLAGPTIHPAGAAEHDPARSPMACSDWIISQEKFKSLNRGHGWCWYEVDRGFSCVDIPVLVSLLLWFGVRWDGGYRASHSTGHHILPDMNRQNGTERNWTEQASRQRKKVTQFNPEKWQASPATCLHSFLKDFQLVLEHGHLRQTESEEQPRLLLDTVDEQRHWCPMILLGGKKDARVGDDLTVVQPRQQAISRAYYAWGWSVHSLHCRHGISWTEHLIGPWFFFNSHLFHYSLA